MIRRGGGVSSRMEDHSIGREEAERRIRCHGADDPCQPWASSACLLGEGYARRVAEDRAQSLDRAHRRGASGEGVECALRDCAGDHVTEAEIREAHAQGVAWAAAQARAAKVAAWREGRRLLRAPR